MWSPWGLHISSSRIPNKEIGPTVVVKQPVSSSRRQVGWAAEGDALTKGADS